MSNGNLFDIIKRDAKAIINSGGYHVDIEMSTPMDEKTVNITGWGVKIAWSFDSDGNQVNTKNAHVTIDEDVLVNLGYPVRNAKKEISLLQHKVSFKDSSGEIKNYRVRESLPDENLGLIYLVLGDYKKTQ